jgi:hypothetical protein
MPHPDQVNTWGLAVSLSSAKTDPGSNHDAIKTTMKIRKSPLLLFAVSLNATFFPPMKSTAYADPAQSGPCRGV